MRRQHAVAPGSRLRFEFGRNWARFLNRLDERRIQAAEQSLVRMLGLDDLDGLGFLDVGCGSGLFSLAARRLGARVRSFDCDSQSVACTRALRERFFPADPQWTVEPGSVLDRDDLLRCGRHDVVYAWGVLHHTGNMWQALANVSALVARGGRLFIAIYNDQGAVSSRWLRVKQRYNRSPWARPALLAACFFTLYWRPMMEDLLRARPFYTLRRYKQERGMSVWTDLIDWVGGYPYEVAKPEDLFEFLHQRGFHLLKMTTRNDLGCNEMVFERTPRPARSGAARTANARPTSPVIL